MKKKPYKLTIPKPCHENWGEMTPNEKGRFCDSCSKTVVDFTDKSPQEIKEYLIENKGNRVCGHFKRSQLDSLVLQIPNDTFQYNLSFKKIFMLALLLAMGTVLFSCKTEGKTQKIDKVEVIDSITKDVIDTLKIKQICKKDSLSRFEYIEELGEVDFIPEPELEINQDVTGLPPLPIDEDELGEPVFTKVEEKITIPFNLVSIPPKFKDTDKGTPDELRSLFKKK